MSVRKRTWKSAKGESKEAWIVDYVDQAGKRRLKTFRLQKEAKAFSANATVEIRQGVHTPDSASITVAEAAELWIASREAKGKERSTIDSYRSHVKFHIRPFIGGVKLSRLNAPAICDFEDKLRRGDPEPGKTHGTRRSPAMVKKIIGSLGAILANAQRRGLVARNVVREVRSLDDRGIDRRAEKRRKGKLRVGVDIPTRQEIKALVDHLQGRWRPMILTAIFTGLRSSELRRDSAGVMLTLKGARSMSGNVWINIGNSERPNPTLANARFLCRRSS